MSLSILKDILNKDNTNFSEKDFHDLETAKHDGAEVDNSSKWLDLDELSRATNLRNLEITNHNIIDISAISKLVNLESLNLWGNCVSEIKSLSSLSNLKFLSIGFNRIEDFSVLNELSSL